MPAATRRALVASELATALSPRELPASASIRQLTVEPVPIPIVALRGSQSSAAVAARLFFSSALIVVSCRKHFDPQKRLCPLTRAQSFGIRFGGRGTQVRVRRDSRPTFSLL